MPVTLEDREALSSRLEKRTEVKLAIALLLGILGMLGFILLMVLFPSQGTTPQDIEAKRVAMVVVGCVSIPWALINLWIKVRRARR